MFSIDELFYGSVRQKRDNAHKMFTDMGFVLANLPKIKEKLTEITILSADLNQQMAAMTMFTLCAACGQKKGGGCCSAFMAGETDAILLLINLLLGVEVKSQRDDAFECCYLGDSGCSLMVKPMFCLNYNCGQILTGNSPEVIVKLEKAASAVLRAQYGLEQMLITEIAKNNAENNR
jgi:hypothetical protein